MQLQEATEKLKYHTKAGFKRSQTTWNACKRVDEMRIAGALVETGVWRGGQITLMRWAAPERVCWLYDTFEGMTRPGPYDKKRDGEKATERYARKERGGTKWDAAPLEDVRNSLQEFGVYDESKLRFVIGDVRETLKDAKNIPDEIAVLRLDTDFYDSTRMALKTLYPRLQVGGFLLIDDYGHWLGCRQAVNDYLGHRNKLKFDDYTGAWMMKEI